MTQTDPNNTPVQHPRPALAVFLAFLQLGLTSFGGPVAHLGYFREAFVTRRKWLDEHSYADLVALCQFLPGPASSQVGIGIGLSRAGLPGALAAWAGFTLPSALLLMIFAFGVTLYQEVIPPGMLHGLKVVAVAVVAGAVLGMARRLTPDLPRILIALAGAALVLASSSPLMQIGVIGLGALAGLALAGETENIKRVSLNIRIRRRVAVASLVLFFTLLAGLPVLVAACPAQALALVDSFFRTGSLVFGGGHVMLPLLQAEVVPPGWIDKDTFLAGYGAAQAIPGPLSTFSAYLGVMMGPAPNGWIGGAICLLAIFAPSFLLLIGVLPFWDRLRRLRHVQRALYGVNAAVVGLLLAALYNPVWTGGILSFGDFFLAAGGLALLITRTAPPWLVVILSAMGGWALSLL